YRLKLMPSLISFEWFNTPLRNEYFDPNARFLGGGRWDAINDAAKLGDFLNFALRPLLQITMRYRDSIHCWDLINEPEWRTRDAWEHDMLCTAAGGMWRDGGSWRGHTRQDEVHPKTATLEGMLNYISRGAQMVRDAGHDATVGFGAPETIEYWNRLRNLHLNR